MRAAYSLTSCETLVTNASRSTSRSANREKYVSCCSWMKRRSALSSVFAIDTLMTRTISAAAEHARCRACSGRRAPAQ